MVQLKVELVICILSLYFIIYFIADLFVTYYRDCTMLSGLLWPVLRSVGGRRPEARRSTVPNTPPRKKKAHYICKSKALYSVNSDRVSFSKKTVGSGGPRHLGNFSENHSLLKSRFVMASQPDHSTHCDLLHSLQSTMPCPISMEPIAPFIAPLIAPLIA